MDLAHRLRRECQRYSGLIQKALIVLARKNIFKVLWKASKERIMFYGNNMLKLWALFMEKIHLSILKCSKWITCKNQIILKETLAGTTEVQIKNSSSYWAQISQFHTTLKKTNPWSLGSICIDWSVRPDLLIPHIPGSPGARTDRKEGATHNHDFLGEFKGHQVWRSRKVLLRYNNPISMCMMKQYGFHWQNKQFCVCKPLHCCKHNADSSFFVIN